VQKLAHCVLAEIATDASSASTATKAKSPTYDPAFWGKGVLNIKNALIYAELKMLYPAMSAHDLRERMLEIINTKQQVAAKGIQRKLRSRPKTTEEQKAAWDQRQSLAINTSLPDRTFTKMPTDPNEKGVPDQSDEDRLKDLGVTLPDAPAGRKLKTFSDGSGGADESSSAAAPVAREIAPIADSDIPAGASSKLREFLKADKDHIFQKFIEFGEEEIIPLLYSNSSPEEAADKLIQLHQSLGQFKANRFINLGHNSSGILIRNSFWNNKITSTSVTIIDLFHDAVRNQIIIDQSNGKYHIDSQKIGEIAIQLFEKLKSQGLMNNSLLPSILSLLKDYRTSTLNNFIINNDLLDTKFTHIASLYDYASETYKLSTKSLIGAYILSSYGLKEVIESNPSTEINAVCKFLLADRDCGIMGNFIN
jgi:hypothetical protein